MFYPLAVSDKSQLTSAATIERQTCKRSSPTGRPASASRPRHRFTPRKMWVDAQGSEAKRNSLFEDRSKLYRDTAITVAYGWRRTVRRYTP